MVLILIWPSVVQLSLWFCLTVSVGSRYSSILIGICKVPHWYILALWKREETQFDLLGEVSWFEIGIGIMGGFLYDSSLASGSLTHWGWVTHICIGKLSIIGSDKGLSPGRRQAIIWTNAGILLIGTLGTNFSEILIEIYTFSYRDTHLKMSSWKWRPFFSRPQCVNGGLQLSAGPAVLEVAALWGHWVQPGQWVQGRLRSDWPLLTAVTHCVLDLCRHLLRSARLVCAS